MQQQQPTTTTTFTDISTSEAEAYLNAAARLCYGAYDDDAPLLLLARFTHMPAPLARNAAALVVAIHLDTAPPAGISMITRLDARWHLLGRTAPAHFQEGEGYTDAAGEALRLSARYARLLQPQEAAMVDLRCTCILASLGRTGRCRLDAPSDILDNATPLLYALRHCGPITVRCIHLSVCSRLQPGETDAALAALAAAPLAVLSVFRYSPPSGLLRVLPEGAPRGASPLLSVRCRDGGGTLLHAICANPDARVDHVRIALDVLGVSPLHLDDALRSPLDLLRCIRSRAQEEEEEAAFARLIRELECREQRELAADPRHRLTLVLARRRGLPDEVGERIARFLRVVAVVASSTTVAAE